MPTSATTSQRISRNGVDGNKRVGLQLERFTSQHTNPDVLVVGAGPAGSVIARELARRGVSVLLVDKAVFPRSKVCGCCLNGAALAALAAIGLGDLARQCGAVPLRSVRLASGKTSAEVALPSGVALSRETFDSALIREAVAAGVTFLPGVRANGGDFFGGPVTGPGDDHQVELDHGGQSVTVSARVVVLATGLAGSAGNALQSPGSRLGAGVVVPAGVVPAFFSRGTIFMATGRGGYVGLVRVEDDRLDVAAAFDPEFVRASGGLGRAAETILAQTGWPLVPRLAALGWKGTPALTRRPAVLAARGVFAVGDAAGYVEPFTGEGMAWAIASAAALAPIARRAVVGWDDGLAREWAQTHIRQVRRRQRVCRVAAWILRSPRLARLAVQSLALLPCLSRPVVAALNRAPALSHEPFA